MSKSKNLELVHSYQPLISIILPTYNQAKYLPEALDSIFNQTLRDFELVIVNDGSTDDTSNILKKYAQTYNFKLINQTNQGLPKALNTGFTEAKGKYLTWTSSDNIMLPAMLEKLYGALENNPPISVFYADWIFIDDAGTVLSRFETLDFDRCLLLQFNFVHCCFLFRREVFEKLGGYYPEYIYSEDWDFWIRASRHFKMKHLPETLYKYRIHSGSMTNEIIRETAPQKIRYPEFSKRLRHRYPLDWYLGKIKKQIIKNRLGFDPLDKWLK